MKTYLFLPAKILNLLLRHTYICFSTFHCDIRYMMSQTGSVNVTRRESTQKIYLKQAEFIKPKLTKYVGQQSQL